MKKQELREDVDEMNYNLKCFLIMLSIVLIFSFFINTYYNTKEMKEQDDLKTKLEIANPIPQGYTEECYQNKITEKYRLVETGERCEEPNNCYWRIMSDGWYNYVCDELSCNTEPFIEYYNETTCVKWILVRE